MKNSDNLTQVLVSTAIPLSKEEKKRLLEVFSRLLGRPVKIQNLVDKKILGGFKVKIGDWELDGTLSSLFENLKEISLPKLKIENLSEEISQRIKIFVPKLKPRLLGKVVKVADGVALLTGLSTVANQELVSFPNGILGVILNLEKDKVGAVVLGDWRELKQGDEAVALGRLLSVPVGEELLGRVVDPLGRPLDGKGKIKEKNFYPLEKIAPGVTWREPVSTPLQTGIKAIDTMIPIGRGQRELIIGDRGTGKTALVIDTIINQKKENVICIYVAIGQKASQIARVISTLEKFGALSYTIVVSASASDPPSFQYLAPYAGCAMGEYFLDQGRDALVVFDDLTKHAWAYRQISLVLRRPSGREAYPGDIFYLHSRLLERACKLSKKYGGGSLTALPIIETQAGDVSAFIPTNLISITDGQIYLESGLFYAGIRPAVNVGLSVSRVGGAAQIRIMKQVAGKLRLELAQYRELVAFTQFAAEIDPKTRALIERGSRISELLKQPQFRPMPVEKEVVLLFAGVEGFLDDVPLERIKEFEEKYLEFMERAKRPLLLKIRKEKMMTEEIFENLKKAVLEFKEKEGFKNGKASPN